MNRKAMLLGQILLLTLIVLANICARMILSPLLVEVKNELGASHTQAGAFFLVMAVSFSVAMLLSGYVSHRINHNRTIRLSIIIVAASIGVMGISRTLLTFHVGLIGLGVGAGLYGPSGLATIRTLATADHWGKAYSLHESGPGIAFVLAPIVAEISLRIGTWRTGFVILSVFNFGVLLMYMVLGRGSGGRGETPRFSNLKEVFSIRSFWLLLLLFMILTGSSRGVYSMLPSYLILEHGLDQTTVNAVVSGSRIAGLLALLLSGLLVDRLGERAVITGIVLLTGACTIFLGLFRGPMLLAAVFLQPMFADAFFPAGLSALAKIGSSRMHTLFVSLIIPMGYAFGAGVVPTIMGYTADLSRFPMGFLSLGVAVLLTLPAAQQLPVERGIKRS